MSYDIYDTKGYISPGPTITGLHDLKKELQKVGAAQYPQTAHFLAYGYATSPVRLKYEAVGLSRKVNNLTVKKTLIVIGQAAAKADDIVILHNHLGKETMNAELQQGVFNDVNEIGTSRKPN